MENYQHAEAFCLMWYGCQCGHRERIWNSRDGVTPFTLRCPSCGELTLSHVDWGLDERRPDHIPAYGQRIFVETSYEMALDMAADTLKDRVGVEFATLERVQELASSIYGQGNTPSLAVHGYAAIKK